MIRFPIFAIAMIAAQAAQADLLVTFNEGAPKDRFDVTNMSACPTGPVEVTVDLSKSAAGLIFDTTAQGQGVEVFQPFELVAGSDFVAGSPRVADGDARLTLVLADLPARASVAFTIDVDDTLERSSNGQTMINGSEIAGAEVSLSGAGLVGEAAFDRDATALIAASTCVS